MVGRASLDTSARRDAPGQQSLFPVDDPELLLMLGGL